ncbi:MAG: peptidoglycan DD-metalloendopeptidase family protein [Lachnospiraceae bacterium]|nr:peptidoglycan DD-metalloendopeptidase family protein [Lachnospiraceae bacterium]
MRGNGWRRPAVAFLIIICLCASGVDVGYATENDAATGDGQASVSDGASAQDGQTSTTENDSSLENAQEKKTELEGSLAEARRTVQGLHASKKTAEQKINELQQSLDRLSDEEESVTRNLKSLSDRISDSRTGLAEARKAADEQYEKMKARIQYMYENSRFRTMDLIFSSGSLADFLKSVEYVSAVYSYDREMLDAYRGYLEAIEQRMKELKGEYLEAEEMKAIIADRHEAVAVLVDAQNAEIERIDGDLSEAQKLKREYEQEVAAQNEVLLAIQAEIARQAAEEEARRAQEAEKKRAEAEAKRKAQEEAARQAAEQEAARRAEEEQKAQEAAGEETAEAELQEDIETRTTSETVVDTSEEDEEDEEYYDGDAVEEEEETADATASGFIWPCPSSHTITSEYGTREAPTAGASTEHRGIDIGAAQGSAIVAAQSGTVITATYSTSGGNMVVISHGKNANGQLVCTAYMHASELYVSVGDQVSQGETIAAVGSTGYSTGPHLHFGVTVGGAYVNPHGYV